MEQNLESVFCLFLGKRRTKKQKINFLKKCVEIIKPYGYAYEFSKGKTALSETINLYFGNIKKAKVILCCYYDTPDKKYFVKNGYYPFNGRKNHKNNMQEKLILNLIFYTITLPTLYFIMFDKINIFNNPLPLKVLLVLFAVFMGLKVNNGFYNSLNFNRNNSSIITILKLIDKQGYNKNIAYAFIDGGTTDHFGAKLLQQDIDTNNPLIIYLDCVGQGDNIFFACSQNIIGEINNTSIILDSEKTKFTDLYFFRKYISITASNNQYNNEILIENTSTKKDINIDYKLIERILDEINILINIQCK